MIRKILSLALLASVIACNTTKTTTTKTNEVIRVKEIVEDSNLKLVPDDPSVVQGTLSNGLKYYIKNNGKPADKVELRLVINAGSIVEDDDQQGLAHFMEHMSFNGTKNFKKNELVDYLQSIGVKFGMHLNAYTSFDETVYILPIPSDDEAKLEKGFQIIEDWAFNALLTDEEINKERGVILEEYRTGLGAEKKMMKNYLPKILYNSKYAKRLPIGKKEILENFNPDVLRRFHKDWYRPDLMAVIAVGDVDVKVLEAKIKAHFDKPSNSKNPRKREVFGDENHQETFVAIESDKEAMFSQVELMYKNPKIKSADITIDGARKELLEGLFAEMINTRLGELRNSANPPFVYGFSFNGGTYVRGRDAYQSIAMANGTEFLVALKALVEENERVKRYGFQQGEFQRAKKSMLARIQKSYENKDKRESKRLVSAMVDNFLEGEPMPSLEWRYKFLNSELPKIQLEEINTLIKEYLRDDNRVVKLTGKEKTVTKEEVLELLNSVKTNPNIKPYQDTKIQESLFVSLPKKGAIVKEQKNETFEFTTLTLSNGAKVIYKKTDFKDDEVLFKTESYGGTSLLNTKDYLEVNLALRGLSEAGIAGLSKNDLNKFMTGKIARVRPFISKFSEGMNGSSTPKDLETLFQLIHLNFTQLNKDKDAYNSYVLKQKGFLGNLLANPQFYFQDAFSKYQYKGYDRYTGFPTPEAFDKSNYDLAYEIYQQKFSNAGDFYFYFVGNIDENKLKEFAEQYIASLPSTEKRENYKDDGFFPITGSHSKTFYKGNDPKSMVNIIYRGEATYNDKDGLAMKALGEIMSIKLVEKLREEASGVYSPRVSANFSELNNSYRLNISFSCGPENVEKLKSIAEQEVAKMVHEGPSEKDLNKAKEAFLLARKEQLKKNKFWLDNISSANFLKKDINKLNNFENNVNNLTSKDVQLVAKRFLNNGAVVGILMPEKE
ncbi:M16 family metallopeptidase [Lutibacter sp.]